MAARRLTLLLLLPSSSSAATFTYFRGPATYTAAREHCQSLGGDIASIRSNSENEEAYALTGGGSTRFGFTDRAREGQYVWSDEWDGSYTAWDDNQPGSDGIDEDCAAFLTGLGSRWHDNGCDLTHDRRGGNPMGYLCRGVSADRVPPSEPAPAHPRTCTISGLACPQAHQDSDMHDMQSR